MSEQQVVIDETSVDGPAVIKRIGRRIVWYLVALYAVSVLDRGNLGFASFSMNKELGITPQMFSIALGVLFLGYSLFDVPSNLILERFGARITLTRIGFMFGIVTIAMAFVVGPYSFYTLRALLGVAEAGLTPGVFLFLSYWIPQRYRARYNAVFSYSVPAAYVLASIVSGAIMQLGGTWGVPGWKWLFMLEGIPAIVLGFVGIFFLTDKPHLAGWLLDKEKQWLTKELENDNANSDSKRIGTGELLRRPEIWVLTLGYIGVFAGMATIGAWLPQILHQMGAPIGGIGFITAIPPLAAIVCMGFIARSSDRRNERVLHTVGSMLLAALGYAIVACSSTLTMALGGFIVANIGVYSSLPTFWSIPQTYLPPNAKAALIGVITSVGAMFGGWVVPLMIGRLQQQVHSTAAGMAVVSIVIVLSALCVLFAGRRMAPR